MTVSTIGILSTITLWSLLSQSAALGAEPTASEKPKPGSQAQVEERGTQGRSERAMQILTLDDIRDVGLALYVVKQQVLNIYAEATRNSEETQASPEIVVHSAIPINTKHLKILPLRREWLVVYLASMEPVVRLLGKEVTEAQTGVKALVIPESVHKEIAPLWQAWSHGITKMNEHLDELTPLLDDAPNNNSKIAQVAVSMHEDVESLERVRRKIFDFVKGTQKDPDAKVRYEQ